jgi:hypothetical protein
MTQESFLREGENVGAELDVSRETETTRQNPIPQILSPREAAGILRISIKALNTLARTGRLTFIWRNERERAYHLHHIKEYLESRTVPATVCGVRRRGPVVPVEPARNMVDRTSPPSLGFRSKGGGESGTRRESGKAKRARAHLIKEMQQWQ